MNQRLVAVSELLFATIIWGFGFTATVWAMESTSSILLSVTRFFGAIFLALPILYFAKDLRAEVTWANFRLSVLPGFLLGMTLILQTWGLEYTTATKSAFITTLYVILVPVIEVLIIKKHISKWHTLWVALALFGTALIVQLQLVGGRADTGANDAASVALNLGDVLTLICSGFAAAHIALLGVLGPRIRSPFTFNCYQSFWAGLLALIMLPFYSTDWSFHWKGFTAPAALGILSLTVGSTMLAFALQVKAQKKLSASLASLIFLLESPFAMGFGIFLLGETLSAGQAIGASLIILAAIGAIKFERA